MPTPNHGTVVSISNTPQAKDDVFGATEDRVVTLDVMANDLGGNGKSLYSVDQSNPLNPALSARSHLGASITIVDGKVVYDSTGAHPIEALAAGQTATDTFSYVIQLGNGALSVATVTVTVTGTNDGPTLSADTVASHPLTELAGATGSAAADTASASLAFTDVDLNDTHIATIGAPSATWSAGTTPAATLTALGSALTSTVHDSTGSGAGSLDLAFSAADSTFDFLGQGETLTVTYNVTVTDNNGATSTQPVTFVVTGTNDGPTVAADAVASHAISETADATGSATPDTASASLSFTDVDLTDTHTITLGAPSATWSGGTTPPETLTALGSALTSALHDSTGSGAGSVGLTFSAADGAFDFLAQGETLTVTYDVTVTDSHGVASTKPVTFTVTGANDAPVLSADPLGSHTINEPSFVTGSNVLDQSTAAFSFHDADLNDHHTVGVSAPTIAWTGGAALPAGLQAALTGALSTSLADSTGTGAGTLQATLSAPDHTFDFLAAGETLTVSYNLTVDDGHGGTSTQPVTFTVVGSDDLPVLSAQTSLEHVVNGGFEQGAFGWSNANGQGVEVNGAGVYGVSGAAGNVMELDVNGGLPIDDVSQTIATQAGQAYSFSFDTALRSGTSPADNTFEVLWRGVVIDTVTAHSTAMEHHSYTVFGDGGPDKIEFRELTTNSNSLGGIIDNVSLKAAIAEQAGQTGAQGPDTGSVTLALADVDLNDVHSISRGSTSIVWSGGAGLPAGLSTAIGAALTTSLTDTTGTGTGSLTATFAAPDATFDFLAQGETLTVTYNLTVNDGQGGVATRPVTFVVTGTNDAPVMAAQASPVAFSETANVNGSGVAHVGSTVLTFTDLDLNDHHTTSIGQPTFEWSGGATVPAASASQFAPGFVTATVTTDSNGTGAGAVTMNYSIADRAVDFLAAGETLKVTYDVTVSDGHGGTSVQPVSLLITGTNDAPVLNILSGGATVFEAAGVTGSAAIDTSTAQLVFTDVDLHDSHTAQVSFASASVSAGAVPAAVLSALQNDAHLSTLVEPGAAAGTLGLTFSAADSTFDFLGAGQVLSVTYNVTVTDSTGATSTKPVVFVINGANDAPVAPDHLGMAVDAGSGSVTFDGLTGATDADQNASLSVTNVTSLPAGVTYNAATHSFTLDTSNAVFQPLGAGETQVVTVNYAVSDGIAAPVATSLSWTVTGVNDQPTLAAGPNLAGAISFYGAEGNTVDTIGANNGTSHGVAYTPGHDGQAFNFTGSNYVTIPNQIPANFTIEGWVKTSANSLGGSQFYQGNGLVYADVGGLQKDFGISILNNHLAFGTGGNFDSTIQSTSVVNTGDWVNFAVTREGSVISIYINGHLEASEDTTYAGLLNAPTLITLGANTIDSRYFNGQLDDLSIYNRALSAAEIQQHGVLGSATLVEPSGVTGASTPLAGSVSLTLTDADLSDTHAVSMSAPVLSWSGGALPAAVASALANVASAAVTTDTVGTGVGAVTVSFGAPQSTFDFLAAGQTLTATYTVTVSDGHGGTATQPVTFNVVGTNDTAVIAGTATGTVHEDGILTAGGTLTVADPDSGEAHFLAPSASALQGAYGVFTFNDGVWTYALDNGAANVQALNTGQTVHDTLTVTSLDGTASQVIDVAIGGQNEPQLVQLLANNSFESGSAGWTNITGVPMEIVGSSFLGIGGDGHLLDTQATPYGITIGQTVDVATGDHATLSFSVAAELLSDGRHPGSTLSFTWDGVVVKTITEADFVDANGMHWNQLKTFTVDVVGQAGGDVLQIHDSGNNSVGFALDWVKVEAWVVT